jgi:paraquat-inducible protein B
MSRPAGATLIGAFVMGALALLVAGLLIVGSGHFGEDRETFALYFRNSTSGLKVGAPVVLKGVQIGVVTDIAVAYDDDSGRFLVPVHAEIDQDRVQWPGEIDELGSRELYETALQAGLRARLGLQSIVTGLQQIEVGFFPGTELLLAGKDTGHRELPTIPSAYDRLLGQVESLPLEHLVAQALAILEGLNRLVNAQEMPRILANLDTTMAELAQASGDLRQRVEPTGDRLDATLDDVQAAVRTLSAKLDRVLATLELAAENVVGLTRDAGAEVGPVAKSLRAAGNSAKSAFDVAEGTLDGLSSMVGERSPLYREALSTLRAVSAAARTLRDLADYLERHPEALIRGK